MIKVYVVPQQYFRIIFFSQLIRCFHQKMIIEISAGSNLSCAQNSSLIYRSTSWLRTMSNWKAVLCHVFLAFAGVLTHFIIKLIKDGVSSSLKVLLSIDSISCLVFHFLYSLVRQMYTFLYWLYQYALWKVHNGQAANIKNRFWYSIHRSSVDGQHKNRRYLSDVRGRTEERRESGGTNKAWFNFLWGKKKSIRIFLLPWFDSL